MIGLALHLAYDGDEVAIAYLGLAGMRTAVAGWDHVVMGSLALRRRADPRFLAVLARLGFARP